MNLAMLGAIGVVALDALDLNFTWHFDTTLRSFPIQIDAVRQHWASLDLPKAAPDLREKLPKNVELWNSWAAVKIENPTVIQKVLNRLSTVPLGVLFAAIVWMLRKIVLTAVGTETSDGDPFIEANVHRLRIIGLLLLVTPLVSSWAQMAGIELVSRSLPKDLVAPVFDIPFSYFGLGLLLFVLAEVFKIGVRLRQDVEGLV
jgi:hypothetical protein